MQQTAYSGEKKNEFMIISLGIASAIILIASLFVEKSKIRDGFKQSVLLGAGSGVMNGLFNFAVMYSLVRVTAALVFPVISGASLLFTYLIAVAFFKEKYHKLQYAGYALWLISVILLNL